jgi:carboxyl-terminal processing protease
MTGKVKPAILIMIAAFLTVIVIATFSHLTPSSEERSQQEYIEFFKEATELVKEKYVEPIDGKKLMVSAINGMLAALDPHNAYMPPEPFEDMQLRMSGSFGGLGMEITIMDGKLTVISPIEDTPAFHAGIKPGDHIGIIDNAFTRPMNLDDAVKRLRGPKGTVVKLTVMREGVANPLVFNLKREMIRIRSVKYRTMEKGYGYIRIAQFQENTGEEFENALKGLLRENNGRLRGMVLDLRNNPGGLVDSAIEVAGRFVGGGVKDGLIVTMKGRDPSTSKELYASIGEKEANYPLVVMINGGSASASEIVAGALQDHRRAVIIGTQSFGKGSVQTVIPMAGGSGLKLTTARYFTPKGRSIQAKGITPDIIINGSETGKPVKAEEFDFREADLDGHILSDDGSEKKKKDNTPPKNISGEEENSRDYQLARALDLLRGVDLLDRLK